MADAERAAAEPEHWAAVALRTLAALGESRSSIAGLTGLSAAQVRHALAAGEASESAGCGTDVADPSRAGSAG
jgi:hypothetical protein